MKKCLAILMALAMLLGMSGIGVLAEDPNEERTLIVSYKSDITNLDPMNAVDGVTLFFLRNIFDTLVRVDDNGVAQPWLATSWDISEDGLVYTYHLRDDVYFTNGEKFTADDCVFTFDRAPDTYYCSTFMQYVESYRAIDDLTFEVTLKEPYGPWLNTSSCFSIMNREAVEAAGDQVNQQPIGTGPYMVTEWVTGEKCVTVRNDNFWGELPKIKTIETRVITDAATRATALQSGDIHVTSLLNEPDMPYFRDNPDFNCLEGEYAFMWHLVMNEDNEYLANPLVRKAIMYALDREAINQVATDGKGGLGTLYGSKGSAGYRPEFEQYCDENYDPEKARELLAEAGYPDGFSIKIQASPGHIEIASVAIQSYLKEVGIDAEIEMVDWGTQMTNASAGNFDMMIDGISDVVVYDLDYLFTARFSDSGAQNFSGWHNDEFEELIAEARALTDLSAREELYGRCYDILYDEYPVIPLYWGACNVVSAANVGGVTFRPAVDLYYPDYYWVS